MAAGKRVAKKSTAVARPVIASTAPGLTKPPPDVVIPSPPPGFVPTRGADYRGFRPKKAELAVVPDVVMELAAFHDYEAVFGRTAPPSDQVGHALDQAGKWTAMLQASAFWLSFVKSQEGGSWKDTLPLMEKLKAPFALASSHDPTLVARYPALARLLGAAKAAAKRAVSTKKRNAKNAAAAPVAPAATGGAAPATTPAPAGAKTVVTVG